MKVANNAHVLWDQWTVWGEKSPARVVDEFAATTLRDERTLYETDDGEDGNPAGTGVISIKYGETVVEGWHRRAARLAAYSGAAWNTDPAYLKDRGFCMDSLAVTLADVTIPTWMLARVAETLASPESLHRYALMPLQCLAAHPNSDEWTVNTAAGRIIDYTECEWWASGDNSGRKLWQQHANKTMRLLLADTPQRLPLVDPGYLTRPEMVGDEIRSRMLIVLATADE